MAFTDQLEKGWVYICISQDMYSLHCTSTRLFFQRFFPSCYFVFDKEKIN